MRLLSRSLSRWLARPVRLAGRTGAGVGWSGLGRFAGQGVVCLSMVAILLLQSAQAFAQAGEAAPPAQTSGDSARLAEALFDEAKQAMEKGELRAACAKLEESRRLDPAGGTQLALGICYERAGRTASAWYAYREALAAAQRDVRSDRETIAKERLAELESRLSRVAVIVPAEVAGLPGLRVQLGDVELRSPSWGLPVPYDAGSHELRVSAPGRQDWTRTIVLGERADRQEIEVPPLSLAPPQLEPRRALEAAGGRPRARPNSGVVQRRVGFVFAGAGAMALLPGIYFGGRAIARGEAIAEACSGNICPKSAELEHQDALVDARRANVLIAAGLLAVGISVYCFLTAAPGGAASASAARGRPFTAELAF